LDENRLQIDVTIEDPVAFTRSWTGQRLYETVDWDIEEFICMDNVNFTPFEDEILNFEGEAEVPE
jgi:hypothetical protein